MADIENDRRILDALVERLAAHVAGGSEAGYWVGDAAGHTAALRSIQRGTQFYVKAVRMAQGALESNDPEMIATAARLAPTLEREGLIHAMRYDAATRRRKDQEHRSAGGTRRGADQRAKVVAEMQLWIDRYDVKRREGLKPAHARRAIKEEMVDQEFIHPITREFPSDQTLRKWLK
jgi:hypothetical protein